MNKKSILLILGVLVILAIVFMLNTNKVDNPINTNEDTTTSTTSVSFEADLPTKPVLFFTSTCPHCASVREYIETNDILSKIDLEQKELNSQENVQALLASVQKCELPQDSVGVPFFWTGEECISGDQDIIFYFENYSE